MARLRGGRALSEGWRRWPLGLKTAQRARLGPRLTCPLHWAVFMQAYRHHGTARCNARIDWAGGATLMRIDALCL